jgi:hypothetical protein
LTIFAQWVARQLPETALQNKPETEKSLTKKNLSNPRHLIVPAAIGWAAW